MLRRTIRTATSEIGVSGGTEIAGRLIHMLTSTIVLAAVLLSIGLCPRQLEGTGEHGPGSHPNRRGDRWTVRFVRRPFRCSDSPIDPGSDVPAASRPPVRALSIADGAAACALLACLASAWIIGWRVMAAVDGPADHGLLLAAMVAGVLACDLAAGTVHWACDRFFTETTPVLGAAVIASFREHHRDPLAMTRRGFLDVNGANYFAVLPLLLHGAWRDAPDDGGALFGQAFVLALAAAAIVTNQLHKWAHAPAVPPLVRSLQRTHLILPPKVHAHHHRGAHRYGYCVTGGWLNPVLDGVDFFGRLERAIRTCGRVIAPGDASRNRPDGADV
jgi:ubiquitin-conjugating enzyme E2 variant